MQRWVCTGRESGFYVQVANQVAKVYFCYLCGIKVLVQGTQELHCHVEEDNGYGNHQGL